MVTEYSALLLVIWSGILREAVIFFETYGNTKESLKKASKVSFTIILPLPFLAKIILEVRFHYFGG